MDLWDALGLTHSEVIAAVGAGGKTSTLLTLAACARQREWPVILTATTKMYARQAADFMPVIAQSYEAGAEQVRAALTQRLYGAWFSSAEGEKLTGLPPEWIDGFAASNPGTVLLVEADGAREKLLKIPAPHEPVIPVSTTITVAVLNLRVLGLPLTGQFVHRLEKTCAFLGKKQGDSISLHDLALVASRSSGVFQYSVGKRTLVLTGGEREDVSKGREFVRLLQENGSPASRCILTAGFGRGMEVLEVWDL